MKLYEIRKATIDTWDDHSQKIEDGPLFNYNLGTSGDHAAVFGYHSVRAVGAI